MAEETGLPAMDTSNSEKACVDANTKFPGSTNPDEAKKSFSVDEERIRELVAKIVCRAPDQFEAAAEIKHTAGVTKEKVSCNPWLKTIPLRDFQGILCDTLVPQLLEPGRPFENTLIAANAVLNGTKEQKEKHLPEILRKIFADCLDNPQKGKEVEVILHEVWEQANEGEMTLPLHVLGHILSRDRALCEKMVHDNVINRKSLSLFIQVCANHPAAFQLSSSILHFFFLSNMKEEMARTVVSFVQDVSVLVNEVDFMELYPFQCQAIVSLLITPVSYLPEEEVKAVIETVFKKMSAVDGEWGEIIMMHFPEWYHKMLMYLLKEEAHVDKSAFATQVLFQAQHCFGGKLNALSTLEEAVRK